MMTPILLAEFLTRVGDSSLDAIPHLNEGGCGLFAHEMYKHLVQKGIPATIRVIDKTECSVLQGKHFSHIVLELKVGKTDCYFDAKGLVPAECGSAKFQRYGNMLPDALPFEQLTCLIADNEGWNSQFKRTDAERVCHVVAKMFEQHWPA